MVFLLGFFLDFLKVKAVVRSFRGKVRICLGKEVTVSRQIICQ